MEIDLTKNAGELLADALFQKYGSVDDLKDDSKTDRK